MDTMCTGHFGKLLSNGSDRYAIGANGSLVADVPSRTIVNVNREVAEVISLLTSTSSLLASDSPGWNIRGPITISIGKAIPRLEISSTETFLGGSRF